MQRKLRLIQEENLKSFGQKAGDNPFGKSRISKLKQEQEKAKEEEKQK